MLPAAMQGLSAGADKPRHDTALHHLVQRHAQALGKMEAEHLGCQPRQSAWNLQARALHCLAAAGLNGLQLSRQLCRGAVHGAVRWQQRNQIVYALGILRSLSSGSRGLGEGADLLKTDAPDKSGPAPPSWSERVLLSTPK